MAICEFQVPGNGDITSIPVSDILTKLRETGVVLFRGGSVDPDTFEAFTRSLCDSFHNPAARASMRADISDGFSTHVPAVNFVLLAHSEGVYIPHPYPPFSPPDIACFFCIVPPCEEGGQTILVDGVKFLDRLPLEWADRFRSQGVIYEALWEEDRWREEFPEDSQKATVDLLNTIEEIEYRFIENKLHFRYKTAAVTKTLNGQQAFATGILAHLPHFNHPRYADQLVYTKPTNKVFFGDGEALGEEVINGLVDIQDDILIAHDWQANDVVLIDNTRFMHGRNMTAKDCERRILSRFGMIRS